MKLVSQTLFFCSMVVAVVTAVPVAVFFAQSLLALLPQPRTPPAARRGATAVLIPAHNEERVLARTLESITPQLAVDDCVVVIADNCSDSTADIARAYGALTLERHDAEKRGKGYAIDAGLRMLEATGFGGDSVMIVDADCAVTIGAIDLLAAQVTVSGRAAQACYVMDMPDHPTVRDQISALAVRIRNVARARGMRRMGLPCQVTGSGIAMPYSVARQLSVATGNIVEDMQIGLDLATKGAGALFIADALVTGKLANTAAARSQRQRWEHGHLATIASKVPGLLAKSIRDRNPQTFALGIDLAVPPLTLLLVSVLLSAGLGLICGGVSHSWQPMGIALGSLFAMVIATVCGWWIAARSVIPLRALVAVPAYALWKLPMWVLSVVNPQSEWVRTSREK